MPPQPNHTDEKEMIAQLQVGNRDAYQDAVRQFTPAMLAAARFYVGSDNAEDVVQDSWIKAIRAIHTFEGRASLKTWLSRIVVNNAKNTLRKSGREIALDFPESLDPELASRFGPNRHWTQPPTLTTQETAEQWLEQGALGDCLDKHLAALPEQQRSALMLFEAHQHKSDDVCNILEVSASNLRVLVHRARQRIFLMVEHFQETGEC